MRLPPPLLPGSLVSHFPSSTTPSTAPGHSITWQIQQLQCAVRNTLLHVTHSASSRVLGRLVDSVEYLRRRNELRSPTARHQCCRSPPTFLKLRVWPAVTYNENNDTVEDSMNHIMVRYSLLPKAASSAINVAGAATLHSHVPQNAKSLLNSVALALNCVSAHSVGAGCWLLAADCWLLAAV